MKTTRKICLILAVIFVVCALSVTALAEEVDYTDAAIRLAALSLMNGDENGDLMLDKGVTRYQAALFFARALTGEVSSSYWNETKTSAFFNDVVSYGTAIDYLYEWDIVKDDGSHIFGFNDPILYMDMITWAVRALGYETADMVYPYDHILAAQKLNLLDNIEQVNYKAEFTRGETAQLIWDMLNTEVAVVDPLTDKILYPGEMGLTEEITGNIIERTTLLELSGFALGIIDGVIVEFIAADEDDADSVDTVVINTGYAVFEAEAAMLGINAKTPLVSYLGLPITLYVDCSPDEFIDGYYEGYATIKFVKFADYTTVENVDGANIRLTSNENGDEVLYLGDKDFSSSDYTVSMYAFVDYSWIRLDDATVSYILGMFEYDADNGYVNGSVDANTYCNMAYREVGDTDGDGMEEIEILYTPYAFGQYVERELDYGFGGEKETFTIIGNLGDEVTVNVDGKESYVTETLIGSRFVVDERTTYIPEDYYGYRAAKVKVEGAPVESGDFMFYNYNSTDNILTVVKNCGTIKNGRMTAVSQPRETVKIDGETYEFGFAGLYQAFTPFDGDVFKEYILSIEAGKNNVQYLAVDNGIVFVKECFEDDENLGGAVAGDINGNGEVDLYDVLAVIGAVVNKTPLEGADMNGDGKITLVDVLKVAKLASK